MSVVKVGEHLFSLQCHIKEVEMRKSRWGDGISKNILCVGLSRTEKMIKI